MKVYNSFISCIRLITTKMKLSKKLFVIDGPNGVGKTTVIEHLKELVSAYHLPCVFTKEPTNSLLGGFIRQHQNIYTAYALAALVAADRYDHIEKLIVPNIRLGRLVVTDRYLASSLVYQVQDGLEYPFIENLNSEIILPRHYFILTASPETIAQRLATRDTLTRFEISNLSNGEGELFRKAAVRLGELGVTVHLLENDTVRSEVTAKTIFDIICETGPSTKKVSKP